MTINNPSDWNDSTSQTYRLLAHIAVPRRAEQIATLLTLIPFGVDEVFKAVELSPGQGLLSQSILQAYPKATLLALEYEESMRQESAARLAAFGGRGIVAGYDMLETNWFENLAGADVVLSSLAVHHLDDGEKQRFFKATAERLSPRGALLLADLVQPTHPAANILHAEAWDHEAESASVRLTQTTGAFDQFQHHQWNLFRFPDPDFDKPSPLPDQLDWLRQAGFTAVDVFWMSAGHAIYGGFKSSEPARGNRLTYTKALGIAHDVLKQNP